MTRRVLAIGLDGYEPRLGERLMKAGRLPALAALRRRSARFNLDHGSAVGTGLAWEHFATGLSPQRAGIWSSVAFDPATYEVWQGVSRTAPFLARLPVPAVVFDVPYFMLPLAPEVQGVVGWSAYDPGVAAAANPPALIGELEARFGSQAGRAILNLSPWNSPQLTARLGHSALEFIESRRRAALWLLRERLPDWALAMVVVSELHGATEALWYGLDGTHPLHDRVPSSPVAARGLVSAYDGLDRLVASLIEAFPDAIVVAFSMNGIGGTSADTASMVLLAELLYRHAFGKSYLRSEDPPWSGGLPMLGETEAWGEVMRRRMPAPDGYRPFVPGAADGRLSIDWLPAARLRPFWPEMPAFALPSFYDGRVRINLAGREARGIVAAAGYESTIAVIERLLDECRDPVTGSKAVLRTERAAGRDPQRLAPTDADLTIVWNAPALGLDHPRLGRIGPLPFRRAAGHIADGGLAWIAGAGLPPGHFGAHSSFDMAPTIVDLLGQPPLDGIDGTSLVPKALEDSLLRPVEP